MPVWKSGRDPPVQREEIEMNQSPEGIAITIITITEIRGTIRLITGAMNIDEMTRTEDTKRRTEDEEERRRGRMKERTIEKERNAGENIPQKVERNRKGQATSEDWWKPRARVGRNRKEQKIKLTKSRGRPRVRREAEVEVEAERGSGSTITIIGLKEVAIEVSCLNNSESQPDD